jgi:hypothetical protein
MPSPDALPPPLPAAPLLTSAAAARWRSVRTAGPPAGRRFDSRRLDNRWLALVPVAFFLLATALEPVPGACTPEQPCVTSWWSAIAVFSVIAEIVLLLVRPRGLAAVPVVVAALLWYLPGGLQNEVCRLAALLLHGLLAAVLIGAELGRRRGRQQLDALMGEAVPYPWTFAGLPSPAPAPTRRLLRCILGWLLVVAAVLAVLTGLADQADEAESDRVAARVEGSVLSVDQEVDTARIGYRLPDEAAQRTFEADILWAPLPQPGDSVPLLAHGDRARIEGQPYDPTDSAQLGAFAGLLGILLLGSAATWVRTRQGLREPGAPALAVLVHPDGKGDLLVRPVDAGPADPPLWRLRTRERYSWDGERWTNGAGRAEPEAYEDAADDDIDADEEEAAPGTLPPELAAAVLAEANRPVPALLYRGPDGPYSQLLVRPPMMMDGPEPAWYAVVCREQVLPPRRGDRHRHFLQEQLAVPALAAQNVEATGEYGPPLPAQRWEMPLGLRLAAGPVVALVLALAVYGLGSRSWASGLLHPLMIGIPAFLAVTGALSWQAAIDGHGVEVASALSSRRIPWERVNAAAVHRHRLAVQLTDGQEVRIAGRPGRMLSRHLGGPYDPQAVAAAIATAANRPERRPGGELRERLVSPQLLVNRAALTGYVVFVIARFFL